MPHLRSAPTLRRTSAAARRALALFALATPLCSASLAATLTVPAQYATIQGAINAASDGDRIEVSPGTYVGSVNFNGKDLEVIGLGGPEVTTIDGNNAIRWLVTATSGEPSSTLLEGFTIRRSKSDYDTAGLRFNSDLTVRNCVIREHDSRQTGFNEVIAPVYIYDGSPVFDTVTIENNIAYAQGGFYHLVAGGLVITGPAHPVVRNSVFRDNLVHGSGIEQYIGGAVVVDHPDAVLTLEQVLMHRNTDDTGVANSFAARALLLKQGTVHMHQSTIADNRLPRTGSPSTARAAVIARAGELTIDNSIITDGGVAGTQYFTATNSVIQGFSSSTTINSASTFVAPASGDFTPACTSPALDHANPATAYGVAIDGVARPIDGDNDGVAIADAGAFEAPNYGDTDGDGLRDCVDNCPLVANADQADRDADNIGNVCDDDHLPEVEDGAYVGPENLPVDGQLVGFDYDDDTLDYRINRAPTHGSVSEFNRQTGEFTYLPNPGFVGTDTFEFYVSDGDHNSAAATVTLEIYEANSPPTLNATQHTTPEDTPLSAQLSATDDEGDDLTFRLDSQPARGTVVLDNPSTGAFTYTPDPDASGSFSFTASVSDLGGQSTPQLIELTVTPVNDAPVASAGSGETPEDTVFSGVLSASDIDSSTLSYALATPASAGSVQLTDPATGAFTYTPNPDANGSDSFTFTASDGALSSAPAVFLLTVSPVNDAPVAQSGALSADQDTPTTGQLGATDIDGDALTFSISAPPTHGELVLDDPTTGAFTYTPDAGYVGADSFGFAVSDGALNDADTVAITVHNVNDAPTVTPLTLATDEDTAVTGQLVAVDPDGDTLLTLRLDQAPSQGVAVVQPDGALTYTPDADTHGSDTFTVIASDGVLDSEPTTVSVTIAPVNDPPAFVAPTPAEGEVVSAPYNLGLTLTLAAEDVDGDTLSFRAEGLSSDAVLDASTGALSWAPTEADIGDHPIRVFVDDGTVETQRDLTLQLLDVDSDGDGVPDRDDVCEGDDSSGDADGDGICDDLDPCYGDNDSFDDDEDGHCTEDLDGSVWDCDDLNPDVYPGAPELCDGVDNRCAGDDYAELDDLDGDGFTVCDGDCDDTRAEAFPGAPELCNGLLDDCDAPALPVDELDEDADGVFACDDCDDADPTAYPGAEEYCDGVDNNCDGEGDAWCEVRADPGCGCSSRSGAAGGWLTVLLLGLVSRRRRSTAA